MSEVRVSTSEGEVMKLAAALLVYRGPQHTFVTAHEVLQPAAGACELLPGTPITREAAARLLDGLNVGLSYKGLIPERLMAIAPGAMAWWCPPCKRTVWFACPDDERGRAIGTRNAVTSHPGLVFAVAGARWYVFAVKGDQRPRAEARLYRAPYFNVWADRGEICTGNVHLPAATGPEAVEAFERAFFESRFTHPNQGFRVRLRGGGYALWRRLLDEKGRHPFPGQVLVPTTYTLSALVRRITEGTDDR